MFGAEDQGWANFRSAHRTTLSMLFGHGDFPKMYKIAPVSATAWLFAFVVAIVFLLANMLLALVIDHYGDSVKVYGTHGMSLIEQLSFFIRDASWTGGYWRRRAYALAHYVSPLLRRCGPRPTQEPKRVWNVPYGDLVELLAYGGDGLPPSWDPVDTKLLCMCDCDVATAEHLLDKCRDYNRRRKPEHFPVERLFVDFEGEMERAYTQIETVQDGLREWFTARTVESRNMEPRQQKVEAIAKEIRPAIEEHIRPQSRGISEKQIQSSRLGGGSSRRGGWSGRRTNDAAQPPALE